MTKKKPEVVTPAEWKARTSVFKFGQGRGKDTEALDTAYANWYNSRIEVNRQALQDRLQIYYSDHGHDWKTIKRNTNSNGLMEWIFNHIFKFNPTTVASRIATEQDNAHSRYGVLYLLGNIDISMDYMGITLEGVGAVGGALASGFGTNYDQLKDVDKVDKVAFKAGTEDVSVADAFGHVSKPVLMGVGKIADMVNAPGKQRGTRRVTAMGPSQLGYVGGRRTQGPAPRMNTRDGKGVPHAVSNMNYMQLAAGTRSVNTLPVQAQNGGGFPLTVRALKAMEQNPVLAIAFAPVSGAIVVGALFYEVMAKLINLLIGLVKDFVNWLKDKLLKDSEYPFTVGAGLIKALIMYTVKKCAAAAVPFVSAGLDLLTGFAQTFKAIKMKVGGWLERRKIRITDGHPALLATRIERCMTMDIASGLWTMLKGAVQLALAGSVPGAQSLVSAITTAVEWVIKFVMRLIEQSGIKSFLKEARAVFVRERALTKKEDGSPHRVVHTSGGLIHDLPEFKAFYQRGCNASPLIAMLTLNTGICGSQWQLQNMFTDIGEISQNEFNSGTKYFTRLKRYGQKYLGDSGFEFNANVYTPSDKKYIQGLLDHAKNDHNESTKKSVGSVLNGLVSLVAT